MKISICVPCFEYGGNGVDYLEYSFQQMNEQIFKDFNVIISDHSKDYKLQKLCEKWSYKLDIRYIRNEKDRGNPAQNTNNAVRNADGEYIKILNQDDWLLGENSLQTINENLEEDVNFLATGYLHTKNRIEYYNYHIPQLNNMIYVVNTIGTPSCVIVKNFKDMISFDENLKYCYDCEWYYNYIQKYGGVKLISNITVGTLISDDSITSHTNQEFIDKENNYILKKHGFIQ